MGHKFIKNLQNGVRMGTMKYAILKHKMVASSIRQKYKKNQIF